MTQLVLPKNGRAADSLMDMVDLLALTVLIIDHLEIGFYIKID